MRFPIVKLIAPVLLLLSVVFPLPRSTTNAAPASQTTTNPPIQVAAGDGPTCAIVNGVLECWGRTDLLNENAPSIRTPDLITGLSGAVTQAEIFGNTVCVLINGGVWCWGFNVYGQVGNGNTSDVNHPVRVSGLTSGVRQLAAGRYHICALLTTGRIKCWGWGQFGQMGNGTTTVNNPSLREVSGITNAVYLAAGGLRNCAILATGPIKCWGGDYEDWRNTHTEPGNYEQVESTPVTLAFWTSGTSAISIGEKVLCAIQLGAVECWGQDGLADGTPGSQPLPAIDPVSVPGLESGVTQIDLRSGFGGGGGGCALKEGALYCWGGNVDGRVGDGTFQDRETPVRVEDLPSPIDSFSVGTAHACASYSQDVYCWGNNSTNQLGDGTVYYLKTPSQVDLQGQITSLTGDMNRTCAAVDGAAWCWGGSDYAALPPAIKYDLNEGVTAITTGYPNFCALKAGAVFCDGNAQPVPGWENGVTHLVSGMGHTCAIRAGAASCMGGNSFGELGIGYKDQMSHPVENVLGLGSGVTDIFATYHNTCAVQNGHVLCWGGDPFMDFSTPMQVANLSNVTKTGIQYAISGGNLYSWNWTSTGVSAASLKPGFSGHVTAIEEGNGNVCVIDNGALKCWGQYNPFGQLGSGGTSPIANPTVVVGMGSGVSLVKMGWYHTCAVKGTDLYCWGDNRNAQVGDNNPIIRPLPVPVVGLVLTQPELAINYDDGMQGSLFRLVGVRFPANTGVIVSVNGLYAGETVTDGEGSFFLIVNTQEAEDGLYQVMVRTFSAADCHANCDTLQLDTVVSASTVIQIQSDEPLRAREGSGARVAISSEIDALQPVIYLPGLQR